MPEATALKRATLYARVSSAEQARPDATSIGQQLDRCANYAAAMGWEVADRLSDDGVTGSTSLAERPVGRQLLFVETDVVIFWSMDRFTRSASRGLADIETLEERGIALVFVKEAIDTSTPSGRLFRTMLAAFAEFERETIRDRNMSGRFGAAEKGRWTQGRLPLGYTLDPEGDIIVNEAEAEVVRLVFSLRLQGMSMPDIAAHLNRKTTFTPRPTLDRRSGLTLPTRFSAGSVNTFLKNEAYAGVPIERRMAQSKGADKRSFLYPVPVIIDPVDWRDAQAPFVGRRRGGGGGAVPGAGEKRATYAFSGRISHLHPDKETPRSMYGHQRIGLRWYRCQGARTQGHAERDCLGIGRTKNGKAATSIDADWIEASALLWLIENLGSPSQVVSFLEATERRLTPSVSTHEAEEELIRVHARRERWLGLYTDGLIDKTELDTNLLAIKVEEAALQRVLDGNAHAIIARDRVAHTLGELLAMTVSEETEEDPHAFETPPRGSSEWRGRLREEAFVAASRIKTLSTWAIDELGYIIKALDITIVIATGEDYRHPVVSLEVGHAVVNHHLGDRTVRFKLT